MIHTVEDGVVRHKPRCRGNLVHEDPSSVDFFKWGALDVGHYFCDLRSVVEAEGHEGFHRQVVNKLLVDGQDSLFADLLVDFGPSVGVVFDNGKMVPFLERSLQELTETLLYLISVFDQSYG